MESKLISLITQLMSIEETYDSDWPEFIPIVIQIFSLVRSMDFDSLPKPESRLMSLVTQTISFFNSIGLDSHPKPLSELISLISPKISLDDSKDSDFDSEFESLLEQTLELESEPELMSLIHQILSLVVSMNSKWGKLISLCPQVELRFEEGKFHVDGEEVEITSNNNKWACLPINWKKFSLGEGEETTHFLCRGCNGKNHKEYEEAPVEIKHLLHPKHSLQLVMEMVTWITRDCYCCDADLSEVFYYCSACDYAMNIACVEKPPVLSIDHPKWHEHTLAHFPRHAPITCDLCALPASKCSPIYMCIPCDFVVHQSCISLPRVIRISRHLHRISFTPTFDKGDWFCGVCRKKIDNNFGGYSCIKKNCMYGAHSKCATQSNVWDGKELEGKPKEEIEEVESYVRISDGIIQHFSHEHHHLRLDENASRSYDENKQCQACITPIYFGNFYSCMQCEFIIHETCANLSRKIYYPIHPHMLTLVGRDDNVANDADECATCPYYWTAGLSYKCSKGCHFKLHVQCAMISEPLVHGSHSHPLFLTSKPGEKRECSVCKTLGNFMIVQTTFNCIECECEFALCFICASIPQKVRYKHDKHMLTLSYGKETSTMTYWCEACEGKINPKERFYMCSEYCCVTLHIECLIGKDLYMKLGSSWLYNGRKVDVMPNNHHMSRPICSECEKRCPHKIVIRCSGSIFCSVACMINFCFTKRGILYRKWKMQ